MTTLRVFSMGLLFLPGLAIAHGGGVNADGCHTERKTGNYHCHGGKAAVAPASQKQALAPTPQPGAPICYTGPRGGTYTITKSGRKNYSGC